DVSVEKDVLEIFKFISKQGGRLDNLINNAGIASMNHFLLTPFETAKALVHTNLLGTFLFCREAARLMRRARYGRIVDFSPLAVPAHLEGEAVYAASKSGVVELTRVLARELGDSGITVNAFGPTEIDTDLVRGVPRHKLDVLKDRQAIKRLATLEDVTNVIDF